jgi:hypothetical protein
MNRLRSRDGTQGAVVEGALCAVVSAGNFIAGPDKIDCNKGGGRSSPAKTTIQCHRSTVEALIYLNAIHIRRSRYCTSLRAPGTCIAAGRSRHMAQLFFDARPCFKSVPIGYLRCARALAPLL